MRCYYHPNEEVVATCTECGKGLCKACASKWNPILCDDCASVRIQDTRQASTRRISAGVMITIIGFIIGIVLAIKEGRIEGIPMGLFAGYILGGVPSGWSALNKIQPSMFLFLPLIGWVIYFVIKFFLAYFIGVVAFPINIYRYFREKKQLDELEQRIQ